MNNTKITNPCIHYGLAILRLLPLIIACCWLQACASPAPQPSTTTITYSGPGALGGLAAAIQLRNKAAAEGRTPTREETIHAIDHGVQSSRAYIAAKEEARVKAKQQGRTLSPQELEQIGNDASKQYDKLHLKSPPPAVDRLFD